MVPNNETVIKWIGVQDYQLAGFIIKNLQKSLDKNGPEFFRALLQELNHPYETGYHKGWNAWKSLDRVSPTSPPGIRFGLWRKFYADASKAVFERREFKPIGQVMKQVANETLQKSRLNAVGIEDE